MKFDELKNTLKKFYKGEQQFIIDFNGLLAYKRTTVDGILIFLHDTFIIKNIRFTVYETKSKIIIEIE